MADIMLSSAKAWLGVSGFGVKLKIYAETPNCSPILFGYTAEDLPGDGLLGNGDIPQYLGTTGIGTYKLWAEHPDNPGVQSNEATYYFDPDSYEGEGDPFSWNGDGIVTPSLIVPGKTFSVYGTVVSDGDDFDWIHCVVATSGACNTGKANIKVCYSDCITRGNQCNFNCAFAFPTNIGTSTFYVYFRDHLCPDGGSQSNIVTLTNVSGTGESYNVGTMTITL